MLTFAILLGLATMWTGPAFDGWRDRRRARRDRPSARVVFVLPSECRGTDGSNT